MNTTITNKSSASKISMNSSNDVVIMDLEFDFELCHTQYSYCCYWC